MGYSVFHLHSDDSIGDSSTKFQEYIELAVRDGMTQIAWTEHGKPLNWVDKKFACEEAGLKFVHGVEIYLTEQLEPKVRDNYHTVLLARNLDGVHEINRLIKLSSDEEHHYYKNRISFDEFLALSDNIITTSACLGSPLNQLPEDHPRFMDLAKKYDYLEVQPHDCDEQRAFNERLIRLSKSIGTPIVAGTDTHNASPYKAECRDMLIKSRPSYGKKKKESDSSDVNEDTFDLSWKTREELEQMFRRQGVLTPDQIREAIDNSGAMLDRCEPFELDRSIKYPILYGSKERDSDVFDSLIDRNLREKLDNGIIPSYQEQAFRDAIKEEIRVFRKLGMCGFMLSMSEILSWCRAQGFALGPARGSVGGSRVAYVTDIIDLNPETWHTVFSRFCNEDREEIGDIDIDCVESDRPAIFKYVEKRFGEIHTARVGSYGTIAESGYMDKIGCAFRNIWAKENPGRLESDNPWRPSEIKLIKKAYEADPEKTKKKYERFFYYMDGMLGIKVSQSIHPAGIVISPLDLDEEYGVFMKDGERCLLINMDTLHEVGAAKYDFLILKTVQVIRDACASIGQKYPRSHEINWNDERVWADMLRSPVGVFQMEGKFAFDSLKKFKTGSIFDMSLVTAAIRPSGASYREQLLARKPNHNPSKLIDDLLAENNGYLVYQCDVIKFLQQICGLSGSEADNIRRAIGRKDHDRLEKALPQIMDGYCSKSDKSRDEAEREATEFLQIIEDASSYMFGKNHSIAYCLLGYLCAYYRYYHPGAFITSYLNNAANDEDIATGTALAKICKYRMVAPKYGGSRSTFSFNDEEKMIYKSVTSIKGIGDKVGDALYDFAHRNLCTSFVDVLLGVKREKILDAGQIDALIGIDFFSEFGNQRELEWVRDLFAYFKEGDAKSIKRASVEGSPFEEIIKRHSTDKTKTGKPAASYTLLDVPAILRECEDEIKSKRLEDVPDITKVRRFIKHTGYVGYTSGKEEDRPKLYVKDVFPVKRKKDGKQFGYSILTQSIGSGKESRFTVFNRLYDTDPIKKEDIIYCKRFEQDGPYFQLTAYYHIDEE